ncbi:hypothetical protein D9M68_811330 [compost metagenome]
MMASYRHDTPSLTKIRLRFHFTVWMLRFREVAIRLLDIACSTRATISNSRGVSVSGGVPPDAPGAPASLSGATVFTSGPPDIMARTNPARTWSSPHEYVNNSSCTLVPSDRNASWQPRR